MAAAIQLTYRLALKHARLPSLRLTERHPFSAKDVSLVMSAPDISAPEIVGPL
jgi:hypothetical protein